MGGEAGSCNEVLSLKFLKSWGLMSPTWPGRLITILLDGGGEAGVQAPELPSALTVTTGAGAGALLAGLWRGRLRV